MANVLHASLTGADLHESKGAAGATAGQVAVASGSGTAPFGFLSYSAIANRPTLGALAALDVAPIVNGGTGATTPIAARSNLGAAASGANTDITSITGSAATLTTGRTIQTNLASTSAVSFNGSANVSPGVTGTLPITNGGTGATSVAAAKTSLDIFANTGQTTGTVAAAGKIGEVLTNTLSSVAITSGSYATVASVTLTAGEWIVNGVFGVSGVGTTYSYLNGGISTATGSNAFPYEVGTTYNGNQAATNIVLPASSRTFNVTTSTTIYLIVVAGVGAGTATGRGYLEARRVR